MAGVARGSRAFRERLETTFLPGSHELVLSGDVKVMETVLVTGAGGYIGSTLVPLLLESGYKVRALDRLFFGRDLLPEHDRLEVIREDARRVDPKHLEGIDYVIDLV